MRTTLTLDDDVAAELRALQAERGEPFRHTVNAVLRAGVSTLRATDGGKRSRFRTKSVSLGEPRLGSVDDISEVLAFAEGENHR